MSEEEEEEEEWDPKLPTTDTELERGEENEEPGRWTRKKSGSQIGSGAHRTGRQSWGKRRGWHMMTHGQILMLE